ncbi:hypothetical protein N431DRAFT_514837 [Stipitochalara longipes BDJ]|nr:hypothetical protein N431DRAFT_514837 [Stipitochalara longipes BDJ]
MGAAAFHSKRSLAVDRLRGNQTLLDIILEEMVLVPIEQNPEYALKKMENLCLLFKMIFCFFTPPDVLPFILNITRTIIEHSIQDPFSTADFTEVLRFLQCATTYTPHTVTQLILKQEHWQPEWEIKENLTPFLQGQKPAKLGPHDAAWFRTWLGHRPDAPEIKMAVRNGLQNMSKAVSFCRMPEELADQVFYHHLVVALEFGIDLQDERGGPSILALCREAGKLYQVRAAFWCFNWNDDDITELFETDLIVSLALQLAHLEHRYFEGRKLPADLHFNPILSSDWYSYLKTLGFHDHKILHSLRDLHAGPLKPTFVSKDQLGSSYIDTGRENSKISNNFPFVMIAVAFVFALYALGKMAH